MPAKQPDHIQYFSNRLEGAINYHRRMMCIYRNAQRFLGFALEAELKPLSSKASEGRAGSFWYGKYKVSFFMPFGDRAGKMVATHRYNHKVFHFEPPKSLGEFMANLMELP